MSDSSADTCTPEAGLDYIFAHMSAIYGAVFIRNWEGIEPAFVRQVWLEGCGKALTYRPKLDYALAHMNAERPPSMLVFKKLLQDGPYVPQRPVEKLTHTPTKEEAEKSAKLRVAAMEKMRELVSKMKMTT